MSRMVTAMCPRDAAPQSSASLKCCLLQGDAHVGDELCFVLWGGDFCPGEKSPPEQGLLVGDPWSQAAQQHILGMWS